MGEFLVAGVQMDIEFGAVRANLDRVLIKLREAASNGAELVVFPECTLSGYCFSSLEQAQEVSIELDSPLLNPLFVACQEHGVHVVIGLLERDGQRVRNTVVCIGPEGLVGHYHKIHLPFLGVDRFTSPGNKLEVFDLGPIKIGMIICYDCSFPEASRVLMLQGADLIVLPTNWPPTSGRTSEVIPNARALENHVYFMSINRIGTEQGFSFIGNSKIVDPRGTDVAHAKHDQEEILYATLDPEWPRRKHLINIPGEHEVDRLLDRRPEAYSSIVKSINKD